MPYFRIVKNENLNLKKIGFISKLNGYNGELVLATDHDDFIEDEFLFIKMDGIAIPFAVEDIFEKGGRLVVKFEDVNNEETALRFVKQEVFAGTKTKKKKTTQNFSPSSLIGYRLEDTSYGDLGPIIRIDEFPQQQMAVCIIKEKEALSPLNEDFIDSIDEDERRIVVSLPEGLIDLYL